MVLCGEVWCGELLCCVVVCGGVWCGVRCGVVLCGVVWCGMQSECSGLIRTDKTVTNFGTQQKYRTGIWIKELKQYQ